MVVPPVKPFPLASQITWKDPRGQRISNGSNYILSANGLTLTVIRAQQLDIGEYTVNVSNVVGWSTFIFNLTVFGKRSSN